MKYIRLMGELQQNQYTARQSTNIQNVLFFSPHGTQLILVVFIVFLKKLYSRLLHGGSQPNLTLFLTWCMVTNKIPGVSQVFSRGKKYFFPGIIWPNPKFSLCKNKTISSNFCHSSSNWNGVYVNYKKYNNESDASAGLVFL